MMTAKGRLSRDAEAAVVSIGHERCADLGASLKREWLVTNGLGGYASGTIGGVLTRRYHGLLIAALRPPLGRTVLVSKADERIAYDGRAYALSANRWHDGTIEPRGFVYINAFRLERSIPVWTYQIADAVIEKRVWMEHGANTTYVQYRVLRCRMPLDVTVGVAVNYRDFHCTTRAGDWHMLVTPIDGGLRVEPYEGAAAIYLFSDLALAQAEHTWQRDCELTAEAERGLDHHEDFLHAGDFTCSLGEGETVMLVFSTEGEALVDAENALDRHRARERSILDWWRLSGPAQTNQDAPWLRQLAFAADQFIVARPVPGDPSGRSIIAGYPWFGDWGRDAMIALAGLTLTTNRPHLARNILHGFAGLVDRGMLPNCFPERGDEPRYNTVDAALWFFEALLAYFEATGDAAFVKELWPVLTSIIDAYVTGTRYGIRVDPRDGLVHAGEEGTQLTWMDAKVGDWVVTPRAGKPIEISALWYNALHAMVRFAAVTGNDAGRYAALAETTRAHFSRFWNASAGYCFDVLDGPGGNDPSLRPNQIVAVSLRESPLDADQRRAVVDVCSSTLLTPFGLRTLAPGSRGYEGRYGGAQFERDRAYHQGTVWPWLIGPFVEAHWRVYGDKQRALSYLAPLAHHITAHGLGTCGEIFDGDPPFEPNGTIAQAWSVAEILRVWRAITEAR